MLTDSGARGRHVPFWQTTGSRFHLEFVPMQCATFLPGIDTNLLFHVGSAFSRLGIDRNRPIFSLCIGNGPKFAEIF